jgi:hypothetical protein
MDAGYSIWLGTMDRDVTPTLLRSIFIHFGEMSRDIQLIIDVHDPLGAEAVIT